MVSLRLVGLKTAGDAHESGGGEHRKDLISGAKGDLLLLESTENLSWFFN